MNAYPLLTLGAACELITDGSHFSPTITTEGYPYVTVRDVNNGVIDIGQCARISSEAFAQLAANGCQPRKGDVLFSKDGSIGRVAVVRDDRPFVVLSSLAILRPSQRLLLPEYLAYVLCGPAAQSQAQGSQSGTAIRRVVLRSLRKIRIPVPPLDEQRRIVDILEDHLSRLDVAKASVRTARTRLKKLRESWLSVHLGDPADHEVHRLGDCLLESRGGWSRSQKHLVPASDGVPYLKMNNIRRAGTLDLDGVVHVRADANELNRYGIRHGDVLFNSKNSGDLIGKTAVATEAVEGWTFNENIMRLRFDARLEPAFVGLWFLAPRMRRQIMKAASASTNVAAVYKHHLIEMTIWMPDLAEQRRLVDESDELADGSALLDAELSAAAARSGNLRRAVLAAAFSGRLTGRTTDMEIIEEMAGV
jgi:type I restriction enzyme, S subunit